MKEKQRGGKEDKFSVGVDDTIDGGGGTVERKDRSGEKKITLKPVLECCW